VWRAIRTSLREAGFGPIRALNLEPLLAGIDVYVERVQREVLDLRDSSAGARVALVAHSMGGLVARASLRDVGAEAIDRIVTIGTPHHGSALARYAPGPAARQMRPDSPWLASLNAAQEGRLPVALTSIYSEDDNLIGPAHSAVLRGAELCGVRGLGHFGLLRSRSVIAQVIAALNRADAGGVGADGTRADSKPRSAARR
jgi:triacylglycerol esterase/lipase EstA (alpha/beta hydrolase family)